MFVKSWLFWCTFQPGIGIVRKVLESELSVWLWRHLVHFGQTCLCNISLLQPDPVFPRMGHESDLGRASWLAIWQLKSSFLKSRPTKPLHQYQPPKWATACLVMGCSEMTPSFFGGYPHPIFKQQSSNPCTKSFDHMILKQWMEAKIAGYQDCSQSRIWLRLFGQMQAIFYQVQSVWNESCVNPQLVSSWILGIYQYWWFLDISTG